MNFKIPVFMLHSVGCDIYPWSRSFLSIRLSHFENFCKYLYDNNYRTLHLEEWYQFQESPSKLNKKYLVLTFDDGYLDNYVYAYPILKKFGLKATIFVNPGFVDLTTTSPRPRYDEKNFDQMKIKNILGFLNWNEIAEMEYSGVMDIQNHSYTHDRYFCSPRIISFLKPENAHKYDWLLWIKYPELKPRYMHLNIFDYLSEGYPVFKNDRSLAIRRYFPNEELIGILIDKYSYEKNKKSISTNQLVDKIKFEHYNLQKSNQFIGRFETDEEMIERYMFELNESKNILKEKLNKDTNFLCWPGGGWNETSLVLADELGYKASTVRFDKDTLHLANKIKHKIIPRIGMSDIYYINGKYYKSKNHRVLIDNLKSLEGSQFAKRKLQFFKLFKNLLVGIKG